MFVLACASVFPAAAAIKIRRPVAVETPREAAPESVAAPMIPMAEETGEAENALVGTVDFVQGRHLLVELSGTAKVGERFNVFDPFMRRVGKASMLKPVEGNVYLLQINSGRSFASGFHLSRETELEAAKYALRKNTIDGYKRFLEFFPKTKYRARIAREMFRLKMSSEYPSYPGNGIEGRITLTEVADREISLAGASIVLDKFIAARTDSEGRFRIEGIPQLEESVTLNVRVSDPKFSMKEKAIATLAGGQTIDVSVELPVQVKPAVLTGRVVDDHGAPMAGVEVWTFPYTREVLTGDDGIYRISRRKKLEAVGSASADDPLFGGEYEVYAHRNGYNVQRAAISAESFVENKVDAIKLVRQDSRREELPALALELETYLEISPGTRSAVGSGAPMINP